MRLCLEFIETTSFDENNICSCGCDVSKCIFLITLKEFQPECKYSVFFLLLHEALSSSIKRRTTLYN